MLQLRIMTFNARRQSLLDGLDQNRWGRRKQAVVAMLERHSADIVCLQEVKYCMLKNLQKSLPAYLWISGQGRGGGHRSEHCPIALNAERFFIIDQGTFWLSAAPEEAGSKSWRAQYPRICTWARVEERATGAKLTIWNTHLDHRSKLARERSAQLLLRMMDRLESFQSNSDENPVILLGDLNAKPGSSELKLLESSSRKLKSVYSSLSDMSEQDAASWGCTYHAYHGGHIGKPIDHIYCSQHWSVDQVEVDRNQYLSRFPSDHYPVSARLSM